MGEELIDFVTLVQGKSVDFTSFLTCCLKSGRKWKCGKIFFFFFFSDLVILLVIKFHEELNLFQHKLENLLHEARLVSE